MRVRTTSPRPAPASARAASMISRHRRAWTPGSGSQEPSGQTGAVPDTSTRSPTRTARLNPMVGSKGDPEDTRCRSVTGRMVPAVAIAVDSNLGKRYLTVRYGLPSGTRGTGRSDPAGGVRASALGSPPGGRDRPRPPRQQAGRLPAPAGAEGRRPGVGPSRGEPARVPGGNAGAGRA